MTDQARPRLVRADGEAVEVPASLLHLMHMLVHYLVEGQTVTLVPVDKVLTTQQAAALLNVSRPYLVKLLDQGLIPHTMTGRHRRVRFADVLQYKAQRDARREEGLVQLAQLSQELGLYDS
ncbi:MAG: helix-turn-helix domain-containing protein [Herpetosiphonaceae bacterium]|nr:helix-turn-helix domain-containing protein [Herpetosiphonaceae bacterium]